MKNQVLRMIAITSVVMVASVVSAHAQAGNTVVVRIPFDFNVAGKTLPAGQYVISRSTPTSSEGLLIRNEKRGAHVQTKTVKTQELQEQTQVIFKRYGDEYFLFQLWTSGRSTGRELFRSTKEQALEREYARLATKPETLAVKGQAR